jgi:hypothetical protein
MVVKVYATSSWPRAMAAASSALSRAKARLDPGGVSTTMLNSDTSCTGKNSPPTAPVMGSASAPTNEPTASATIARRWSSAHPITRL